MAFDITQSYVVVEDASGNKYYQQGGTLYNSSSPYTVATQAQSIAAGVPNLTQHNAIFLNGSATQDGAALSGTSPYSWSVPSNVRTIYATVIGGGQGGAGGHATGGGGGGGGASVGLRNMPISVTPGQVLTVTVGTNGPAGGIGAAPAQCTNAQRSAITDANGNLLTPGCHPNMLSGGTPTAGAATNGGNGGWSGPNTIAATKSAQGGAGGAGAGAPGSDRLTRGWYQTTGGAGGAGGASGGSAAGTGGQDEYSGGVGGAGLTGNGGGGAASMFGEGGLGGDDGTLNGPPTSPASTAYGAGGGGGHTNHAGAAGAPGIIIITWLV